MKIIGAIFSAGLVVIGTETVTLRGTRYKQRMMNVDTDGLAHIYEDGSY